MFRFESLEEDGNPAVDQRHPDHEGKEVFVGELVDRFVPGQKLVASHGSDYLCEFGPVGKRVPDIIVEVHVWNTLEDRCRDPPEALNVDFTRESWTLSFGFRHCGVTSIELVLCQGSKLNPLGHGSIIYHPHPKMITKRAKPTAPTRITPWYFNS